MISNIATVEICVGPAVKNTRYLWGLVFICLQCMVWVAASVLTQYMYEETSIQSPFLMTYVGVTLLAILLPFKLLFDWYKETHPDDSLQASDSFEEAISNARAYTEILELVSVRSMLHATSKKQWNHKKHVLAALFLAPAMFLSDYAYNRGLQMTTVASCTVLISTACVFVLFLSVLLQLEPFKCGKLIGVILTVVGTALTTIQDAQQDENSLNKIDMLRGDMISLIAAVGYAVYSVQARVLCPQDEELYSMPLLLGYVGLLCAVPLFPMAIYQFIRINVTWKLVRMLVVKGLLDFVVTDYLLFRAVMLTNATVANVGLGLSIPMAFAADYLILNTEFTHLQIIGALAVLAGFVTVNIMNETDKETVQELGETELNSQTLSNVDDTTVPYNPPPAIV